MNKIVLNNLFNESIELTIVDDEKKANFITHNGTFHADEVMATCILLNKFNDIKLYRTSNVNNKEAFVYDIGFGKYDHHALDFTKTRENGIKYASCGLIWEEFGRKIVEKLGIKDVEVFFNSIDKSLIMDIDRDDNGQSLGIELPVKIHGIPSLIASFNPSWDDLSSETVNFLNAVCFANNIFNNIVGKMVSKEKARKIVEEKIEQSKDGILVLDSYMPWKDIVLSSNSSRANEILYAIFPSKRGGYNVVATPKEPGSFEVKKPFPSSWAGLENETLQNISGIKTITFCHKSLFICACKTFEDAKKIAEVAINNKDIIY